MGTAPTNSMNKILKIHANHQFGFSVVEIIIIVLILGLGFLTMMQFYKLALSKSRSQQNETQASYLASAGLEAVRQIRDRDHDWDISIIPDQDYQIIKIIEDETLIWQLVAGSETIGQFQRVIKINSVNRDTTGNIVLTDGNIDPETKKITTTISWHEASQTRQIYLATYLTKWTSY